MMMEENEGTGRLTKRKESGTGKPRRGIERNRMKHKQKEHDTERGRGRGIAQEGERASDRWQREEERGSERRIG